MSFRPSLPPRGCEGSMPLNPSFDRIAAANRSEGACPRSQFTSRLKVSRPSPILISVCPFAVVCVCHITLSIFFHILLNTSRHFGSNQTVDQGIYSLLRPITPKSDPRKCAGSYTECLELDTHLESYNPWSCCHPISHWSQWCRLAGQRLQ